MFIGFFLAISLWLIAGMPMVMEAVFGHAAAGFYLLGLLILLLLSLPFIAPGAQ